jgi:hypothetical protein
MQSRPGLQTAAEDDLHGDRSVDRILVPAGSPPTILVADTVEIAGATAHGRHTTNKVLRLQEVPEAATLAEIIEEARSGLKRHAERLDRKAAVLGAPSVPEKIPSRRTAP